MFKRFCCVIWHILRNTERGAENQNRDFEALGSHLNFY